MQKNRNILGPVICELRKKRNLSQAQLAAKLNVLGWDLSRVTLAKIETQLRCITDYEIPHIAAALGTEPTELLKLALKKSAMK